MAENFSPNAHWRDSARATRFFLVDYRAAFPLLLFLLHIQTWTFIAAALTTLFLALLERYGFTVTVFLRWLRATLAGPHKFAIPWWKE
jgi:intracellular multiplication protein IcmT